MTSARLAAMQARREAEFLDVCAEYQDRLAEAKDAVRAARESGDDEAAAQAYQRMKEVGREVHEFRAWAKTMGSPPEGRPGRDAVIRMGG
ncbi:hypothetical protein ABT294_00545 [Nonomuraea sp. NPDC000554]|uniref:hypothetical protein n=1 Tax=Nonomuraea sp. NPDC000554 TaxID=3154259 RepID=UPI003320010C